MTCDPRHRAQRHIKGDDVMRRFSSVRAALVCVGIQLCCVGGAMAQEVATADSGGWTMSFRGATTFGVGVRTKKQKSNLKPGGGNNSDDADLNYAKGDTFSRVVKANGRVDINNRAGTGILLSGMAWYDDSLVRHPVPHGNNPNDYVANQALSDSGFAREARFRGASLLDAYVYGQVLNGSLSWHLGRLTLQREAQGFSFPGGLRDLDARNTAAASRPGALIDEEIIPFWGTTARWTVFPELRLDAFLQFAQQKSVGAGCGTFFAANDYTPNGCDRVFFVKTITERENVVRGTFVPRAADATPTNRPDQFGLSSSYLLRPLGTRVGISFAHYHSRSGYTSSIKGAKLGPAPGFGYELEYPGNKNMLSFTTATRVPSQRIFWLNEISVTNGQPIQLNPSSLLAAFLRGQGPLAADAIALPANSLYHGYDRFRVIQAQTGVLKEFGAMLGTAKSHIGAEIGIKHVVRLPDSTLRPYSRPELDDVCATEADCATQDGFVTPNAWGYRVRAGVEFVDLAGTGISLRPTIAFAHDVKGWSYDYAFVEGRKTVRLSLDADVGRYLFGNVTYGASRGGLFNTRKDMDFLLASVGIRFWT
jgi:hypothetical protein